LTPTAPTTTNTNFTDTTSYVSNPTDPDDIYLKGQIESSKKENMATDRLNPPFNRTYSKETSKELFKQLNDLGNGDICSSSSSIGVTAPSVSHPASLPIVNNKIRIVRNKTRILSNNKNSSNKNGKSINLALFFFNLKKSIFVKFSRQLLFSV
jgi:hypothetical protein